MPYRHAHHHRHIILGSVLAALACGPFAAAQEKPVPRRICMIVAGTRPEVTFEKRGELYIEVDAPVKSIPPSQIDIMSGKKEGDETIAATLPANLNDLVTLDGYKGGASLQLVLKRPILPNNTGASVKVSCDLGKSRAPLIIIYPKNPTQGWDDPAVRVYDAAPASLPANAILCVNLTAADLGTRFGSATGPVSGGQSKVFTLPESSAAVQFPFKVDLMLNQRPVTIAHSSYLKKPASPLVLLAIPLFRVAPGNPPVSLQFLSLPPPAVPQP